MRVFFVKSGKWGCFFVKSGPFHNAGCNYVQYLYFFILHFTYLGVRTHSTHPLPTGLITNITSCRTVSWRRHRPCALCVR